MADQTIIERLQGQTPRAIGFRVQVRREMLGIELEMAAQHFKVSTSTWRRLESGDRPITVEELLELCDYLDCPVGYLLDREEEPGIEAVEHLIVMLWRALPSVEENPWIRVSLLEMLRKTVGGYVEERTKDVSRSIFTGEASEED